MMTNLDLLHVNASAGSVVGKGTTEEGVLTNELFVVLDVLLLLLLLFFSVAVGVRSMCVCVSICVAAFADSVCVVC